jgi:small subunit ribosomal protein S17
MNATTTETTAAPAASPAKKAALKRTLIGRVVSDKMNKTVTVLVERRVKHATIGKYMTRSKKFHAHSENNEFKLGDLVEIVETAPISKTKAWKVARLLEKSRLV